ITLQELAFTAMAMGENSQGADGRTCGQNRVARAAASDTPGTPPGKEPQAHWIAGRPPLVVALAPVIHEAHVNPELRFPQSLHHGLQVVLALAEHANLVILNLSLHLELGVLDDLHDFPSLLDRDALLEPDAHPNEPARGLFDLALLQRL